METRVDSITLELVKEHPDVHALIKSADDALGVQGFTEHGFRHAGLVSHIAQNVLVRLERPERRARLAAIAGYLHDIGNVVNRADHATAGALIAKDLLLGMGMHWDDLALVVGAIGNHEERIGEPVSDISAAVIIATFSIAAQKRNLLWSLAAAAGLAAVAFAIYVYFYM